ncbi:uncharacterized protein [Venturia canescens]|uniref:uncharacterized protein n=1 Tax=Venturia canescens TaxID=32260 RepID=UPI001C9C69E7|nr:uncharacterized protein LOC122409686 [Venturia canescens]
MFLFPEEAYPIFFSKTRRKWGRRVNSCVCLSVTAGSLTSPRNKSWNGPRTELATIYICEHHHGMEVWSLLRAQFTRGTSTTVFFSIPEKRGSYQGSSVLCRLGVNKTTGNEDSTRSFGYKLSNSSAPFHCEVNHQPSNLLLTILMSLRRFFGRELTPEF